jgi:uncharacterized protein
LRGRTRLLILQGTPFCNIDCGYCYLPHRDDRSRMRLETVGRAVAWVTRYGLAADPLTIFWHAGEPLTLPPEWYASAIAVARAAVPASSHIMHRVQTNATLIDDRWCALFRTLELEIGVSLDGPAWLHDARRRTRGGQGTHAMVMRGVRLLQRHGIPFHVICVVGTDTLGKADELADFFLDAGVEAIGFNIEEIEGTNLSSSLAQEGAREGFARFLDRFLDRADRSRRLRVREAEALAAWLRHPDFGRANGNEQNSPFAIVTVTHNGDIATYSPELAGLAHPAFGDFTLGNVATTTLDAILGSDRFRALCAEIETGVAACAAECSYFGLCRGGAPSNKLAEHGGFGGTETLFCRFAEKTVADVVLRRLEAQLGSRRAGTPTAVVGVRPGASRPEPGAASPATRRP